MRLNPFILCLAAVWAVAAAGIARAHMTPPVVYLSDRDAVVGMTSGAKKHFVREVKLTPEEQRAIASQSGWRADESFYRFYLGRGEGGQIVSAVTFMTEFTIHGPMRVAVSLGGDGKVKEASAQMAKAYYAARSIDDVDGSLNMIANLITFASSALDEKEANDWLQTALADATRARTRS